YVNTVRRYPPAQSDRLQFPSASQEQQDPRSCNSGPGNHNREKHAVRCETGAQPVEIKSTHNHFAGQVSVIFGTRLGVPVAGGTLQTAINFNNARASADMPFFNQDIFDLANALEPGTDDPQPIFGGLTYNEALAIDRNAGINRIDAAISQSQPRCRRVRHRQSGVGYRSDLWRPLHFREIGSCCGPPDIPSSASASSGQHSVSPR